MGIPPRHIGDSIDVELLHEISKLLDRMEQIICCRFFTITTTSTTTTQEIPENAIRTYGGGEYVMTADGLDYVTTV